MKNCCKKCRICKLIIALNATNNACCEGCRYKKYSDQIVSKNLIEKKLDKGGLNYASE